MQVPSSGKAKNRFCSSYSDLRINTSTAAHDIYHENMHLKKVNQYDRKSSSMTKYKDDITLRSKNSSETCNLIWLLKNYCCLQKQTNLIPYIRTNNYDSILQNKLLTQQFVPSQIVTFRKINK